MKIIKYKHKKEVSQESAASGDRDTQKSYMIL